MERAGAALELAQQGLRLVRRQKPHGRVLDPGQTERAAAFDRKRIGDAQVAHFNNMVDGPAQESERVAQALVAKRLRQPLLGVDQDLRRDGHDGQGVQAILEVALVAVALRARAFALGVRPGEVGVHGLAHGDGTGRGRIFAGGDLLEDFAAHLVGVGRPDAVGVAAHRVPAELAAGVVVAYLVAAVGDLADHSLGGFAIIYAGILRFDVLTLRHDQGVPHGGVIGNDVSRLLAKKEKRAATFCRNPLNSHGGQCRIRIYGLWLRSSGKRENSRPQLALTGHDFSGFFRAKKTVEPTFSQRDAIPPLSLSGLCPRLPLGAKGHQKETPRAGDTGRFSRLADIRTWFPQTLAGFETLVKGVVR